VKLLTGLFETLPGRVQCEMLLKVTEQCFNTLERSEMLLLLLRRFPETVVQHGVGVVFLVLSVISSAHDTFLEGTAATGLPGLRADALWPWRKLDSFLCSVLH